MLSTFEIQARVAAELGVAPTQILSRWVTEVQKELGMEVPYMWDTPANTRGSARCPSRYRTVIITILQGESQN